MQKSLFLVCLCGAVGESDFDRVYVDILVIV
jgi:hypothetical protein